MSSFRLPRRIAAVAAIGVAGACLAIPAIADSPLEVTFQANNPWTQEVGSVSRRDSSHDYSVAVAADKTLQINLVTRDPNVFFIVKNQTEHKQLVDTYQTGATTWSTQNAAAATYTIHVYVQPEVMQRGEVADYALQIGQYGKEEMQAPTTTVTFEDNKPWVQAVGSLASDATSHDYAVAIAAGETLQVNLITQNPELHFRVEDQTHDQKLVDTATTGGTTWSTPVTAPATYEIQVYVDPTAMPPGRKAGFALQIGHYPTQGANPVAPVAAGTAARPAPSAAASAAAPAAASTTGH